MMLDELGRRQTVEKMFGQIKGNGAALGRARPSSCLHLGSWHRRNGFIGSTGRSNTRPPRGPSKT